MPGKAITLHVPIRPVDHLIKNSPSYLMYRVTRVDVDMSGATGYFRIEKPLRWADGVAVRGRLKGKSRPVVDNQAVSIARDTFQETSTSIQQEAAHFGLHATDNCCSDIISDDASLLELVTYHNTRISASYLGSDLSLKVVLQIARLSPEAVQNLPRDVLNCILGTAAVHMAVRHPGNRPMQRLALETKVTLFQGINRLFQHPQSQRADLLLCYIALMFAMDAMENGNGRWGVHFAGGLKVLASSGGMENFASHYPHMKSLLAQTLYFETMQALLVPIPTEQSNIASRKGIQTLCYDLKVRKVFFATCPLRLMEAVYDMGSCAQNIFRAHGMLSTADVYKREWILSAVLDFSPEEGTRDVQENYYSDRELTSSGFQTWNLIFRAWKSAITVVVLRHLYFGLPNPELPSQSRSPTPSIAEPRAAHLALFNEPILPLEVRDRTDAGPSFEENPGAYYELGHLEPAHHLADSISRTPSPLFSSRSSTDNISLDFWNRRYEIHNEAFSDLSSSLLTLAEDSNPEYLRYSLVPFMILALVSRSRSPERALCLGCFDRFKRYMLEAAGSGLANGAPSPVGGHTLDFDVPWDKLDIYSEELETERRESTVFVENQLRGSAPEWNWWYMLKRLELKTIWPITAGTMHMELGAEFWPFNVLSGLLTDDCFTAFMQPPTTTLASSST
ncbi:Nn.00g075580.m01.CDS01 [Neocucurbitaria sp. VM-36]